MMCASIRKFQMDVDEVNMSILCVWSVIVITIIIVNIAMNLCVITIIITISAAH